MQSSKNNNTTAGGTANKFKEQLLMLLGEAKFLNLNAYSGNSFSNDIDRIGRLWSTELLCYSAVTEEGIGYDKEKLMEHGALLRRLAAFNRFWEDKVNPLIREYARAGKQANILKVQLLSLLNSAMFLNADAACGLSFSDDINRVGKLWSIEVLHYGCVTETGVSYDSEKLNELGQLLAMLEYFTRFWDGKVSPLIEEYAEEMIAAFREAYEDSDADLPE